MKVFLLLRHQHAFQEPICSALNHTLRAVLSQIKLNRFLVALQRNCQARYYTLPHSVTEFYSFQKNSNFLAKMAASLVTFFSCFLHGLLVIITALRLFAFAFNTVCAVAKWTSSHPLHVQK
jgi:hypothetical protein